MGLLDRVTRTLAESRAISTVPWKPWDDPSWSFAIGGPAHPSHKDKGGVDGALSGLGAVYAATRYLADNVAALPLQQYRNVGLDQRQKMQDGQLLSKPCAYGTMFDWLWIGMTSLLLWGNAYGYITSRDGYGYPVNIEWMPPERVQVVDVEPFNPVAAQFYYYDRPLSREDIFHVRGYGVPGRTEGISPIRAFATLIGSGHDALSYGADWYKAGGFPPGTFRNTEYEVDEAKSDAIKERLVRAIRRRQPLVFGRDWEFHEISVPPNEAQFIEAMRMNATQVAAIYGIPPEKIGGGTGGSTITYANAEGVALNLVSDVLDPWLVRFESALFGLLPDRQYARFNRDARARTDATTRHNIYQTDRTIGLRSVNEIRAIEDMPPIPGGDDYTPLQVLVANAQAKGQVQMAEAQVAGQLKVAEKQAQNKEKQPGAAPLGQQKQAQASPHQQGEQFTNGESPTGNGSKPKPQATRALLDLHMRRDR